MRVAKLYMAQGLDNKNKYYLMEQVDEDTFRVESGRIGVKPRFYTFDMSRWDAKYREKTKLYNPKNKKGGYVDRTTDAVVGSGEVSIGDPAIATLFRQLQAFSSESIQANFTVGAGEVTQSQIDHAVDILQDIVDLADGADVDKINNRIEALFTVIPRVMKSVSENLLPTNLLPHVVTTKARGIAYREQDNLDILAQQVASQDGGVTTLEDIGLSLAVATSKEFDHVSKIIESENRHHLSRVFVVVNHASSKAFGDRLDGALDKTVQYYWHGSQNARWLSILRTGLKKRPVHIPASGYDMFGKGIYFADKWQKSFGYTSTRGAFYQSEYDDKGYMALFKVHTGRKLSVQSHDSWCYELTWEELQRRGSYDSVAAERGRGISLLNSEYVVYNNNQVTMEYLIEVK